MLVFYYEISDLLKEIKQESVRFARQMKDEQGKSKLDELSAGAGDEAFLKKLLKEVSSRDILNALEPYTRTLADLDDPVLGYEFDATYTDEEDVSTTHCIIFRMIEETLQPTTTVTQMEDVIKSAMVHYCVAQFLFRNGGDGSLPQATFEKDFDQFIWYLNRRSLGLKRKPTLLI